MFNLNAYSTVIFSFIEIAYIFFKLHNSLSVKIYCASMPSHFSHVQLCDSMDVAYQPLGFSMKEYWNRLPPCPRDLPDPGIEPVSLMSLALEKWIPYH